MSYPCYLQNRLSRPKQYRLMLEDMDRFTANFLQGRPEEVVAPLRSLYESVRQGYVAVGDREACHAAIREAGQKAGGVLAIYTGIGQQGMAHVDQRVLEALLERHVATAQREQSLTEIDAIIAEGQRFRASMKAETDSYLAAARSEQPATRQAVAKAAEDGQTHALMEVARRHRKSPEEIFDILGASCPDTLASLLKRQRTRAYDSREDGVTR